MTNRNRDRNEIIESIMQCVKNAMAQEGIGITRIMYNSYVPYNVVNQYLKFLIQNGSLEYHEPNKIYSITEKGLRFLELQNKLHELIKGKGIK